MSGALVAQMMASGGNSFTPVTHTYSTAGSGTETIPVGASTVVIECYGGGGGGGCGFSGVPPSAGSGGGGAGYSKSSYSVVGHIGQTMSYIVGAGGTGAADGFSTAGDGTSSSISSGSFSITGMLCNPGHGGAFSSAGTGGTASGGNVSNVAGGAGQTSSGTAVGNGGSCNGASPVFPGTPPTTGMGMWGALGNGPGAAAPDGTVQFSYT